MLSDAILPPLERWENTVWPSSEIVLLSRFSPASFLTCFACARSQVHSLTSPGRAEQGPCLESCCQSLQTVLSQTDHCTDPALGSFLLSTVSWMQGELCPGMNVKLSRPPTLLVLLQPRPPPPTGAENGGAAPGKLNVEAKWDFDAKLF